ncbi:MAG: GNAT family N-acetyltransferase [Candidatus Paceibacterota bacterium]|jgi:ribosomal protein S18 acetylase RimI-like enzyme
MMHDNNKTNWTIRKAIETDSDAVCELLFLLKTMYGSSHQNTLHDFLPIYLPVVKQAISLTENHIVIAEKNDGYLIGFISLSVRTVLRNPTPIGSIEEIYVRTENRRNGVGTALWRAAVDYFMKTRVRRVEVITSLAHPGQRPFSKVIGMEWYSSVHTINL